MDISAQSLLAIRDAMVANDVNEAYFQLLHAVDPDAKIAFRNRGNHWFELEAAAAGQKQEEIV